MHCYSSSNSCRYRYSCIYYTTLYSCIYYTTLSTVTAAPIAAGTDTAASITQHYPLLQQLQWLQVQIQLHLLHNTIQLHLLHNTIHCYSSSNSCRYRYSCIYYTTLSTVIAAPIVAGTGTAASITQHYPLL